MWTLIMFVYFFMAFVMVFGTALGYVQWTMGDRPWGLLAVPVGSVVITGLHIASQVRQRLSAEQMHQLRSRLDGLIEHTLDATDSDE